MKPLRVVVLVPGQWWAKPRAHQAQCLAIGDPDLVPDVVRPGVGQLCVSWFWTMALHLEKVHVLDVCIVIRESPVDRPYPFQGETIAVGKAVWTGMADELKFVAEPVNVAYDLPQPAGIDALLVLGHRDPCQRNSSLAIGCGSRCREHAKDEKAEGEKPDC